MNVYKCPSCGASFDPLKVTFLSTVKCEFCGQVVSVYGEQYQRKIITKIKQIKIALQDKDCEKAQKLCKKALNMDPENAELYYLKILSDWWLYDDDRIKKAVHEKVLANGKTSYGFKEDSDYQKAYRFGDEEFKKYLEDFDTNVVYNTGVEKQTYGQYKYAIKAFEQIEDIGYKDTEQRLAKCRNMLTKERFNTVSGDHNSMRLSHSDNFVRYHNNEVGKSVNGKAPQSKNGMVIAFLVFIIGICAISLFSTIYKNVKPVQEERQEQVIPSDTIISNMVDKYNENNNNKLTFKGSFTPSYENGSHYRTEFRLPAFSDATGITYDMSGKTVDFVIYEYKGFSDYNIRIYADGLSLYQCKDLIKSFSPILDDSLTTAELNETISYIDERKEANGYYYGDLGLVLLGNGTKGYSLMIKKE
ncbi:MAG: hypothetical protein IKP75_01715 [Oscillospiraceae bacterium]|nr:hypothetical protein [Oscillospiraceae bacterium]